MSTPSKSIRRIFNQSGKNKLNTSYEQSPQTPKRKPIFSEQKKSTMRKNIHSPDSSGTRVNTEWRVDSGSFLEKMLSRVQSKSRLLQQLEIENSQLKRQNYQIQQQNQQILKKIAIYSGVEKLKQKNSEYRAKLLKAEALLYQLRRSSKQPVKGLDELIDSLQI